MKQTGSSRTLGQSIQIQPSRYCFSEDKSISHIFHFISPWVVPKSKVSSMDNASSIHMEPLLREKSTCTAAQQAMKMSFWSRNLGNSCVWCCGLLNTQKSCHNLCFILTVLINFHKLVWELLWGGKDLHCVVPTGETPVPRPSIPHMKKPRTWVSSTNLSSHTHSQCYCQRGLNGTIPLHPSAWAPGRAAHAISEALLTDPGTGQAAPAGQPRASSTVVRLQFQPYAFTYYSLPILGKAGKGFLCEGTPSRQSLLRSSRHRFVPRARRWLPHRAPQPELSPPGSWASPRPFLFPCSHGQLAPGRCPSGDGTFRSLHLPVQGAPSLLRAPSAPQSFPPFPQREELRSPHSKRGRISPPCWRPLAFIPWRWGLFPSPPAQAPAAGTDPSLPSCSSPPYLLSSPQPPPPTPPRRETLPGRHHGNARHRQGSPALPLSPRAAAVARRKRKGGDGRRADGAPRPGKVISARRQPERGLQSLGCRCRCLPDRRMWRPCVRERRAVGQCVRGAPTSLRGRAGLGTEVCHHPALQQSPHSALISEQLWPLFSLIF